MRKTTSNNDTRDTKHRNQTDIKRADLKLNNVRRAVLATLPFFALASFNTYAACSGTIASPVSAAITEECTGTGTAGDVNNTGTTARVDTTTTSTAGNNILLQFDGQGRTLTNTGSIINDRVITGTTGARGRTAILMGSATLNASASTTFNVSAPEPTAGATTVTLRAAPLTSYVGQTIVFGRYDGDDFSLGVTRIITAVDTVNKTVTFADPLPADFAGPALASSNTGYKVVSNYGAGSTVNGVFYNNVINNSGTISSQILAAEINGNKTGAAPNTTSVSYTAAVKAITASVEGDYLINNTAGGVISAKQDGIGSALAIEEGGAVSSMTINNAGTILAQRSAHLTLVAATPTGNPTATSMDFAGFSAQTIANVNAINTQEEAEEIIINNTQTGIIRSKGDYTGTIYMRAEEKEITNDGLIEHIATDGTNSKGFAIAAVSNPGEVRTLELENSATGTINGDILVVNGNALRYYLLSTEGGAAGIDSRLNINSQYGQSDSGIENAGTINGNLYFSNGTHELENEGVIIGNIDVDQRNTFDVGGNGTLSGTKQFTFENEGTFTGNITIRDVAGSTNEITLEGDGFNGKIAATTGAGSNTLNLKGSGTLRDNVTKFTTLNVGESGTVPVVDDDDDEPVAGAVWTLASGKTFEFTNSANVNGGTLEVLGNLLANTTVNTGATLSGTGTVTGNVTNNGIVKLDDKTLHITGNLISESGSNITAAITPTANGLLAITGTATINGTTITPTANFKVETGTVYTLLTSSGLTLTDSTIINTPLLKWTVVSDANNLLLKADSVDLMSVSGMSSAGAATLNNILANTNNSETLNNLAIALQAIDNEKDLQKASGQLSPEANGGAYAGAQVATGQFSSLISLRQDANQGGASGVSTGDAANANGLWFQGFGFTGEQDKRKNADGYDADTAGFALGYDRDINDNLRLGFAGAYATTSVDANNTTKGNTTDIDSYQASVYGTYSFKDWYLDGQIGYAKHKFDSKRLVSVPVTDVAKGSFDADQYMVKLGANFPFKTSANLTLIPTIAAAYSYFDQDGYTERSNNGTGLQVKGRNTDSFRAGLGAKALWNLGDASMPVTLEARALWWHEFSDVRQDTTARFAAGGSTFHVNAVKPERDSGNVGLTLSASAKDASQVLSVSYDAEIRDQYIGHTGSVTARFNF